MVAVTKRRLKNEISSPPEEKLYDSFEAFLAAHRRLKDCKNLLHAPLLEYTRNILDGGKYEQQGSLVYLRGRQEALSSLHIMANQDYDSDADEETQLVIHREGKRFADALAELKQLTKTHSLLQLHFELLARYSERYEESRILPLSRLRDAFFDVSTVAALERYLVQAERLEERGVAVSEFRVLFNVRLGANSNGAVTSARSAIASRRDLLDELWAHSVLGFFPQYNRLGFRSLALAAKRPHPGVRFQPSNGVVIRRGA